MPEVALLLSLIGLALAISAEIKVSIYLSTIGLVLAVAAIVIREKNDAE